MNPYAVTFNGNGGTPTAGQSVDYGGTVTKPADPTKTGHTFEGWYADAGLTSAYNFAAPMGAANMTLYAKWAVNDYTVTYDGNGAEFGVAPASGSHAYDTAITLPGNTGGLAKTGHTFAGWNTAANGSGTSYPAGGAYTIGTADVTLYAQWSANPYTISFESNGGSPVNVQTVRYGSPAIEPEDPTRSGFAFVGWYTDHSLTSPYDFVLPIGNADFTLYAGWASTNALLSGLSVDQGMLNPVFSPSNIYYEFDAAKTVTSLNLYLTKGDPAQSVTVTGATYQSVTDAVYAYNVSNLTVGPNSIRITVTAENQDQLTYQLLVNVSADEAMGVPVALDPSVRTLTFPGGLVIRLPEGLSIPPGATLTVRESSSVPSGDVKLSLAGQVIDYHFEGMTIDQPVEITLGYDANEDLNKLAVYYYNETTGKWEYQPSRVTDSGITTSVGHFSTYGVLADTIAPDQVIVTPGEITTTAITLYLAASDDSGVASYRVYRDGVMVAETAENTYVDMGLAASRTYHYTMKAIDRLGNISNDSESIAVATNGNASGGGGGTDNGGGGSAGGTAPSHGTVTSTNGTITIPVGRSGEVRMGDAIKIVIPAGASDEELKITIETVTDTHKLIKEDDLPLSPIYEIMKSAAANFNKDVALTFVFDPTTLTDGQKPSVFFYDESKQVWVEVGGVVNGNTITASVNHFTKFAVFTVDRETVSAPDGEQTIDLSDISGHWAEGSIQAAVGAGIVKGYADGTFKPNAAVTRAEFTVMLMNAPKPQATGTERTFTDTAEIGAWARAAVAQAVEAGIVTGYGDGSFRPAATITRAEMAVMIARAADIESDTDAITGFADDGDIPAWAKGAVAAVRQAGILQGRSGGQFAPDAAVTRAEAVAAIVNMIQMKD